MNCSRCGKSMSRGTETLSAISISISPSVPTNLERDLFIKKQMGKYADKGDFNFCYECWIDSLMGGKDA